jgi:hypothetical protein
MAYSLLQPVTDLVFGHFLRFTAGFWWQLLFNVEKTPALPDAAPEVAAAAASTVVEFVGVRCHVNCGAHDYWPRVVRFKASIAALQVGCWVTALCSLLFRAVAVRVESTAGHTTTGREWCASRRPSLRCRWVVEALDHCKVLLSLTT